MWQNIIMDSLFKNAFEWGLLACKLDHTQQQIPSMTGTGYHHNNTQKKLLKGTACIQCLHSSMFNVCIFLKPHTRRRRTVARWLGPSSRVGKVVTGYVF